MTPQKSARGKFHQIGNEKRASVDGCIAGEMPTSRYQSANFLGSPYLDSFRVATTRPGQ
jgi:hypothetical protein